MREFAEDFGKKDRPGTPEAVVAQGAQVFCTLGKEVFHAAGAGTPVAHAGDHLRKEEEAHVRVFHHPEQEIVIPGDGEGGIEEAMFPVDLAAQEERGMGRHPSPPCSPGIEGTALPGADHPIRFFSSDK